MYIKSESTYYNMLHIQLGAQSMMVYSIASRAILPFFSIYITQIEMVCNCGGARAIGEESECL